MKFVFCHPITAPIYVAPYMGAWIEISKVPNGQSQPRVAPYMGAWIEISLPEDVWDEVYVAPYMGAWIEIIA